MFGASTIPSELRQLIHSRQEVTQSQRQVQFGGEVERRVPHQLRDDSETKPPERGIKIRREWRSACTTTSMAGATERCVNSRRSNGIFSYPRGSLAPRRPPGRPTCSERLRNIFRAFGMDFLFASGSLDAYRFSEVFQRDHFGIELVAASEYHFRRCFDGLDAERLGIVGRSDGSLPVRPEHCDNVRVFSANPSIPPLIVSQDISPLVKRTGLVNQASGTKLLNRFFFAYHFNPNLILLPHNL